MIHDAPTIPLAGRTHVGQQIRQWLGDSRGGGSSRGKEKAAEAAKRNEPRADVQPDNRPRAKDSIEPFKG